MSTEHDFSTEELRYLLDHMTELSPEFLAKLLPRLSAYKDRLKAELGPGLANPSVWAREFLRDPNDPRRPLSIREYQALTLDDDCDRKVYRWGRRSGKTVNLSAEALFWAYNFHNFRVIIVAASKPQVENIFNTMEMLIGEGPLKGAYTLRRQPNYEIRLQNGAIIRGFVAGIGEESKRNADRIRGQSADLLIIDEMDLIAEEAISSAIMPIANTINEATGWTCRFVCASTPRGKRGRFYQYCATASVHRVYDRAKKTIETHRDVGEDNGWHEYHFPSEVIPGWISIAAARERGLPISKSHEFMARLESGYEGSYEQEYLAEFGEDIVAVFQDRFLDSPMNLRPYRLGELPIDPNNIYIAGVDTNGPTIGAHFCVLEYVNILSNDPDRGRLRYHYHEVIKPADFEQRKVAERMRALDGKYGKFAWIYMDEGFGNTIIEYFNYLTVNGGSDIASRLVSINFARQIAKVNLLTGEEEKTYMKPFMVRHTAALLELGKLVFPVTERSGGIIDDMKNFFQEGVTASGVPKYTQKKDHRLIAYMLAVIGFHQKYAEIANPSVFLRSEIVDLSEVTGIASVRGSRQAATAAPIPAAGDPYRIKAHVATAALRAGMDYRPGMPDTEYREIIGERSPLRRGRMIRGGRPRTSRVF